MGLKGEILFLLQDYFPLFKCCQLFYIRPIFDSLIKSGVERKQNMRQEAFIEIIYVLEMCD